ncbi:hypothetical protein TNCV_3394271 [Trichonephila clavipes]|nr:hypothetical protein TNCV_3394271 [Trichonephila clavipes]
MKKLVIRALYRSPLTVTLWPSSFLKKYGPMIPPAHKALQTVHVTAIVWVHMVKVAMSFPDNVNAKRVLVAYVATAVNQATGDCTRLLQMAMLDVSPDGHGYELVSSVRALVPQKFSVEEELMHVKHVEVKSPHVGVMWKFGRGVISSGPPAALTGEGIKLPFVFEAVREIYRNIFGLASFEKVDRFRSEIQLVGHPVRWLTRSFAQ